MSNKFIIPDPNYEPPYVAETHTQKFKELSKTFEFKTSVELNELMNKLLTSYDAITEMYEFTKITEPVSHFSISPKLASSKEIFSDLTSVMGKYSHIKGFEFKKIPWASIKMPDEYDCPHGEKYKDAYIFFMSAQDDMYEFLLSSLKRFDKLKAFS